MRDDVFQGGPRAPFSVDECKIAVAPMSEGDILDLELTFGSTIGEHEGSVDAYVAAVNQYRADIVATGPATRRGSGSPGTPVRSASGGRTADASPLRGCTRRIDGSGSYGIRSRNGECRGSHTALRHVGCIGAPNGWITAW